MLNLKFKIAVKIIKRLNEHGFTAYFAGGAVRDMIMKKKYKDIDIATDAVPDEIIKLFKKCILVGKQFGVIKVIINKIEFEITTFRTDINYIDGRHPHSIKFATAEEDAKRRDFTINALFYDLKNKKIIDYVNGIADIKNKIIRAVGNPIERFEEDKLRMIRAIRFSARFGFEIEKNTLNAIKQLHNKIIVVSQERCKDELEKILTGPAPDKAIELLSATGILKIILPEVENLKGVNQPKDFHPEGDVFTHTMLMLKKLRKPSFTLAFAALLHDIGKPQTYTVTDRIRFNEHDSVGEKIAEKICERLKLSNIEKEKILSLIGNHMKFMFVKKMRESKLKRFLMMENFNEHLELHRLDCIASHKNLENYYFCKKKLEEFANEINKKNIRFINGNDLIALGFTPGPVFKKIFQEVEDLVLEKKLSSKEECINYIKEKFKV